MKLNLTLTALLSIGASAAIAGPLVKQNVDYDAKWLVHVDFDQFRDTKLGQFVMKEVIVKKAEEAKAKANNFITNLDVVRIVGQLHSVTAYGTGFDTGQKSNGVLMLQVEPETRKILEGVAAGLLLKDEDGSFTKTNEDGQLIYCLKNELFASPQDHGLILFSKSKPKLKQAAAVLAGKSRNLVGSKAFTDFPPVTDSFIFMAVAEGFQDNLPIPPQAKVLRKADGVRVVLGESADNVFANVAVKAKDPEVLKEMQQVVEGMLALASLSQSENKELQQLVRSTKVETLDKMLCVATTFPTDALLRRAGVMIAKKQEQQQAKEQPAVEAEPKSSAGDSK
jgi:hypothetical protein